jgi:hypothetical protein
MRSGPRIPTRLGRGARAAALVLMIASVAASGQVTGESDWQRIERGGVTVVHRTGDARAAQRILDVAVAEAPATAAALGARHTGSITLYVASTDEDFRNLTLGGAPDWGAGVAFPERGVIVVRSPAILPDPLQTEDLVAHEIAHVIAGRALGSVRVPRWFDEGIAMMLAGEWRLPGSGGLTATGSGDLIPLSELRTSFPHGTSGAMLAYVESYYAVAFLMEQTDVDTPAELVQAIRSAGSFDAAIHTIYGGPIEELEENALRSFERRFGWGFLLTRWNIVFLMLALLLLLGGALRVRRSRDRMRRWEEEEAAAYRSPGAGVRRDTRWQ